MTSDSPFLASGNTCKQGAKSITSEAYIEISPVFDFPNLPVIPIISPLFIISKSL